MEKTSLEKKELNVLITKPLHGQWMCGKLTLLGMRFVRWKKENFSDGRIFIAEIPFHQSPSTLLVSRQRYAIKDEIQFSAILKNALKFVLVAIFHALGVMKEGRKWIQSNWCIVITIFFFKHPCLPANSKLLYCFIVHFQQNSNRKTIRFTSHIRQNKFQEICRKH